MAALRGQGDMIRELLGPPQRSAVAGLGLIVLAIVGCGRPSTSDVTGDVSGKVTYAGKPLPSGIIVFVGLDGTHVPSQIHLDGSYVAQRVPVGTAQITVNTPWERFQAQQKQVQQNQGRRAPRPVGRLLDSRGQPIPVKIPAKYGDVHQSGLTYTVRKGSQIHDIDLPME
jgi:hypothetical protein